MISYNIKTSIQKSHLTEKEKLDILLSKKFNELILKEYMYQIALNRETEINELLDDII